MAAPNIVAGTMPAVRGGMDLLTVTLSPAEVAANTSAEQTFTVSGLAVGDIVIKVEKPTAQAGIGIVGTRVSAANTLAVVFMNTTAAAVTPTASESYLILVHRPYQARTETTFGG
jgi:hypothetical protein